VARPDLYPLDPTIERAFDASEVLALELALDEAAQVEVATRMMERARLPAGQRIDDVVSEETFALLVEARGGQRGGLFGLRGFHPWFVAVSLTMQALQEAGFSADHGIDEYFKRRAGERSVVALETVDEQLDVFAAMSPEDEEAMLRETLEDLDEQSDQLGRAFELWRAGDADELDRLLLAPMRSEQPELYEKLFAARNRRMLEVLERLTGQRPARYFVVVGAGHLVGPGGLVDLLRRSGHRVEQLEGEGVAAEPTAGSSRAAADSMPASRRRAIARGENRFAAGIPREAALEAAR
jgi:uncharacterized protein YbaP (TraB family)